MEQPAIARRRSMSDPRGDAHRLDQVVASRLRRVGQSLTPRRRSLLEILRSAVHPLTIHEILERGAELAMSSAYRNLTVLEHAGVVNRVITKEDFGRYELADELTEQGFTPATHRLDIVGLCADCAARQRA